MPSATDRAFAIARRQRRSPTRAEAALWKLLRDRRFETIKFRRQVPIGRFVADYACLQLRLVIELDGGIHRIREAADAERDAALAGLGFKVLRFDNDVALTRPDIIQDAILHHATMRLRNPSPRGGEGGGEADG